MSILKEQITLLKSFLKGDFKKLILISSIIFLFSCVIGLIIGYINPELAISRMQAFSRTAAESNIKNADGTYSPLAFVAHNWSAMLTSVCMGFIPFLFLSVVAAFTNGSIMGLTTAVFQLNGTSLLVLLAGILPHGIFEIPAMILSFACGMYLCLTLNRKITRNILRLPMIDALSNILRVMLLLVAPLLIAAGFVEALITPWVMNLIL